MSSFESLILRAPLGFTAGCGECNAYEDLAAVVDTAVHYARMSGCAPSSSSSSSSSSSKRRAIKSLLYIINARNTSQPQPEIAELASVLDQYTTLSRASITALAAGLESYSIPAEQVFSTVHNGKLTSLQWRLGVSLASSSCKNLLSPYVALSFTVIDGNGQSKMHTSELTYKEFQEFYATLQQVSSKMDSL